MSIKNIIFSILAVGAFSSFVLAQGQPNQPNQPPREGMRRMERGDGGMRVFQMRRPGMMRQMRHGGGMNFERLNLTDAQKQRIQSVMEANRKNMESMRAQAEEIGKLMQLKRQGLLTTEQGTRLTSLQAQMQTNGERAHNEILSVLTPEQKTLFDQMKNNRGNRMRGMRDRMQMRRGPGMPNRPGKPATPPTPPIP